MKIKLKSKGERLRLKYAGTSWHRWFAWRPVRFDDETIVWLQMLERHVRFNDNEGVVTQYRYIP